jgi:hypothetical protein
MKKIVLLLVVCVNCLFANTTIKKNEIGIVFGVPDMINLKYLHYFNRFYLGLNSGFNPSKTTFIPGIYAGYKALKYNDYFFSTIEFIGAYWPKMAWAVSGGGNSTTTTDTDWLNLALRPTIQCDLKRVRLSCSFGIDMKAEIFPNATNESKWRRTSCMPSFSIGSAFIF